MAEDNDKTFSHFPELPPEVRMMFIDRMEPDDRCRFSGCSKLSNSEAKNSKNYIFGISVAYDGCLQISVLYNNCQIANTIASSGYFLEFKENESDGKFIECFNPYQESLWKTKINNELDMLNNGMEHFVMMLRRYKNTIKMLSFQIGFGKNDFGIDRFKNLEYLKIFGYTDIPLLFSKMRKPCKRLSIVDTSSEIDYADYDEIYEVQEYLIALDLKLNCEQFQRISASCLNINIGSLTEIDIFNFIKSWQNGKMEKKLECYQWDLKGSNFDEQQLLELLGAPSHDFNLEALKIKHQKEAQKIGELVCCIPRGLLSFEEKLI